MSAVAKVDMRPYPVRAALMVDDDPEIEALVLQVLGRESWAIQHATDNMTAFLLAQRKGFDLILTSQKTSGQDDVDLLRKIRRVRPHTRLIILTDSSTPSDVIESMRERAFSYFSKPFSMDALAAMVRMAVEEPCWDDGIEVVSATPEWIRIRARCDLNTADRVLQFFEEIADLPNPENHAVGMAFREILLNAIEHGGKFDPTKHVEIGYVRVRHMVTCRISDPGEGFTLDEIPHAAVANPADDPIRHFGYREAQGMRPGGFGVLLAQKLVDELIYSQDGNEVLLIKYIGLEASTGSSGTASQPRRSPES
jgi:CheY-like chemotaxis protein/anti-sigma regulatory factor (Ser/Thr protein kinase)